jgi:membrane fusion protein, heavy metal efflux system
MRYLTLLLTCAFAAACDPSSLEPRDAEHADDADSFPRGPHGGRLLEDGALALEIAIYEAGMAPEFHVWATDSGRALPPEDVNLRVELRRLGGAVDRITFTPAGDYLRGNETVEEPHSFDVEITASHAGREHRWSYESYEGRTTIADAIARDSGIATAIAGPGRITDTLTLYGAIATDLTRVREVQGRFPGVIRSVTKRVGDGVRAGDVLATIESNESLQTYSVTAPLAGVVTARHAEPGEQTSAEPLFEIVDLSTVWAELSVFSRDRARLSQGAPVHLVADSGAEITGTIDYLAPVGNRASQSVTARVVIDNAGGQWTPGQFVEARVNVSETPVALAVPASALQRFRELDVVFAKVGDVYEVRMVTLGRRDAENVEILGGLAPGTEIVVDNSYLVKADIEKAGASHDH